MGYSGTTREGFPRAISPPVAAVTCRRCGVAAGCVASRCGRGTGGKRRHHWTLVLRLKRPSAVVLTMLATSSAVMMPAGIAERVGRKDPQFLVGTGPFKYKSYTPGVDFQAERNPHYWKPGLPHIAGYRAVVMGDLTKIFASFRVRQLTMTGIARHLERPEADVLHKDFPEAVVAIGPRAGWDSFVMNHSKPPVQ
jgi:ABC-type oligopeptide transport system substrate-binding subunit